MSEITHFWSLVKMRNPLQCFVRTEDWRVFFGTYENGRHVAGQEIDQEYIDQRKQICVDRKGDVSWAGEWLPVRLWPEELT